MKTLKYVLAAILAVCAIVVYFFPIGSDSDNKPLDGDSNNVSPESDSLDSDNQNLNNE